MHRQSYSTWLWSKYFHWCGSSIAEEAAPKLKLYPSSERTLRKCQSFEQGTIPWSLNENLRTEMFSLTLAEVGSVYAVLDEAELRRIFVRQTEASVCSRLKRCIRRKSRRSIRSSDDRRMRCDCVSGADELRAQLEPDSIRLAQASITSKRRTNNGKSQKRRWRQNPAN